MADKHSDSADGSSLLKDMLSRLGNVAPPISTDSIHRQSEDFDKLSKDIRTVARIFAERAKQEMVRLADKHGALGSTEERKTND